MKNAIPVLLSLFVLFFLSLHYHYYVPVVICVLLGAAFASYATVTATRVLSPTRQ